MRIARPLHFWEPKWWFTLDFLNKSTHLFISWWTWEKDNFLLFTLYYFCMLSLNCSFVPYRNGIVTGKWCKSMLALISHQWSHFRLSFLSQWRCYKKWPRSVFYHIMYFVAFVLCYCICTNYFSKCSRCRISSIVIIISQLMEYSYLLDMADKTDDPYMRLVYACKHRFIVSLSLSHTHTHTFAHTLLCMEYDLNI